MNPMYVIAAIVIIGGLSGFLGFQIVGLIKEIRKRKKIKKQEAEEKRLAEEVSKECEERSKEE